MANEPLSGRARPHAAVLGTLVPGVLILCATVVAYLPVWHAGFIWDDEAHVTANPSIVGSLGLARVWTSSAANYFPLTTSTFWVIHALWGLNPLPYHVIDVLLHAASAVLLGLALQRLQVRGAWIGALLWALHPVQVESAAWVSELKNTQSAVFYLLSVLCFLRWVEAEPSRDHGDRWGYYAFAWLGSVLAILSKSSTVMLPMVLGICWWWVRGRWRWRNALWLVPFLLVSAAAGAWTIWEQRYHSGALGQDWDQTLLQRVILSGKVFWFYLGKLLWPHPLIFIYPRWALDATSVVSYLPVLAAAGGVGWLWWRRDGPLRPVFFAAAVFGVSLFPVLGFFSVYFFHYSFVGDHFQYLASMAALALAGAGLAAAGGWLGRGLVAALAVPLGALTWSHCGTFRDNETLYQATLAHNPDCWMAHENLGSILARSPATQAMARAHFEAALRSNPGSVGSHFNLANLLAGDPAEVSAAIAHYREAIRLNPYAVPPRENLGNLLARLPGRLPEAIAEYNAALELQPQDAPTHYNLGVVLLRLPGRLPEAIQHLAVAVEAMPTNADAHNELGNALAEVPGREAEAMAHYEKALELRPDFAQAHYNLALMLLHRPDGLAAAIAHLETSLRLNPASSEAHYNLGAALLNLPGRERDAAGHFEAAIRLNPRFAPAHYALAVALDALPDRRGEARAHVETALQLDPGFAPAKEWILRTQDSTGR